MEKIKAAVEKHKNLILEAERYIWKNPETGYKEVKTTAYLKEKFTSLGYTLTEAEGITGFTADLDTGRGGPCVMILAELDSIICPEHKDADKTTGAVHSCGHNAQCAALLGIAAALKEPGILDGLSGKVKLALVPAEELLEIEYRSTLKESGVIKYFGGKSEFLRRGLFDGVDAAFMVHTATSYCTLRGSVGCITKNIIYKGKAAHAGGSPQNGINALYAASCGLNAINAIRETFTEDDIIRVHPIITSGGSMVNAIPSEARLESYVRGKSFEAIERANKKVNRALIGAALSIGANIEIIDSPGYSPLVNDENMIRLAEDAANLAIPEENFAVHESYSSGSTDMGDLSCIMPVCHPYARGMSGTSHGADYEIADPDAACVKNAVWQMTMLKLLLENGAGRAEKIIAAYKPIFTKEEFLKYQDSLNSSGDRITYTEGGASVRL